MPIELKVPEIGESIREVEIGDWPKKEGDGVLKDDPAGTPESEKATVELPAAGAGTNTRVLKQKGDVAKVGEVIAYLEGNGSAAAEQRKPEAKTLEAKPPEKPAAPKSESKAEEPRAEKQIEPPTEAQEKPRSERLREEPRAPERRPPA